jgi:hypothetical protein
MPGLVPGIHVYLVSVAKTWMAGTSPAMTIISVSSSANGSARSAARREAPADDPVFRDVSVR